MAELSLFASSAEQESIAHMTYEDMLRAVRCRPLIDPLFKGEAGKLFHASMKQKRSALSPAARAAISEKVGW